MAGEKRQITRNRISYSCQKCRQRKVKCDKQHPLCGSCQKNGEECIYVANESEQPSSHEPPALEDGHNKKRKSSLAGSQPDNATHDGASVSPTDQEQLLRLRMLLDQLSKTVAMTATEDNRIDSNLVPESQQLSYNNDSQTLNTNSTRPIDGTASSANDDKQSSTPNLEAICTQLNQLVTILQDRSINTASQVNAITEAVIKGAESTLKNAQNLGEDGFLFVPSDTQRNALFRSWLSSVYPVLPVVDPAITLIFYRTFHFWYMYGLEKDTPNPCEDYVPLIYAIYYAGAVSMSLRGIRKWFPGIHRQQVLGRLRKQFMRTLDVPKKLLTNPATLAARIMMFYMSPDNNETGLMSNAAPLIQTAYSLNLHRERPNESLEPRAAEVRRRVWWETVNLDTMEAIFNNVPPSINHHYCDTLRPSEIKATRIDTPEAQQYATALQNGQVPEAADDPTANNWSSMVSVINVFMKARTLIAVHERTLLDINLAAKPKTKDDMIQIRQTLEDVDEYTSFNIDRIPAKGLPELDFTPTTGKPAQSLSLDHGNLHGEDLISIEVDAICGTVDQHELWEMPYVLQYRNSLASFHKWARIVLSLLVDQQRCYSYTPFLSNTKRKMWMSARMCALKHAHSYLRKFNYLATDLELERFRWAWPSFYRPIHACVMILLDCFENPNSQEAPRSRALFDQMLSLSLSSHGIVGGEDGSTNIRPLQESGNEAFAMLMQLRAKAWHKAGLDPSLLWTERDQIDVGVAAPLTETEKRMRSIREDTVYDSRATAGAQEPTLYSYRPMLEQRAKEYTHPSEAGIPEEDTCPTIIIHDCNKHIEAIPHTDKQHIHRARSDQQRTPAVSDNQIDVLQNTESGLTNSNAANSKDIYRFKPPSELYDVSELIRRIRSVQRSNQPTSDKTGNNIIDNCNINNKNPEATTTNIEVSTVNAPRLSHRQSQHASTSKSTNISTNTNTNKNASRSGSGSGSGSTNNSQVPQRLIHTPAHAHTSPKMASTSERTQEPVTTSEPNKGNPETTAARLINMDFDWDKWDAIFGHLLDDGFGDVDLGWDFNHENSDGDGEFHADG